MENNVKVLKLITGEEVIARVEPKNTMLILETPMILQIIHGQHKMSHVLVPWIMSGKGKKISISIDHVIAQDDLKDQVERDYLSTITGLTL
jgi:hypothetical protein